MKPVRRPVVSRTTCPPQGCGSIAPALWPLASRRVREPPGPGSIVPCRRPSPSRRANPSPNGFRTLSAAGPAKLSNAISSAKHAASRLRGEAPDVLPGAPRGLLPTQVNRHANFTRPHEHGPRLPQRKQRGGPSGRHAGARVRMQSRAGSGFRLRARRRAFSRFRRRRCGG